MDQGADRAARDEVRPDRARAIALDHESAAWHALTLRADLGGYGEPPCAVFLPANDQFLAGDVYLPGRSGGLFLASDVPVLLFDGGYPARPELAADIVGGVGRWVPIPDAHCESPETAAAWACEHVGTWGELPTGPRRPRVRDVDDQPRNPHAAVSRFWRYGIADQPCLRVTAPLDDSFAGAGFAGCIEVVRSQLVEPIMSAFKERGGEVAPVAHPFMGTPHTMMVSLQSSRSSGGKTYSDGTIDWEALRRDVASKRSRNLLVEVNVADGDGHPLRAAWGALSLSVSVPGARLSRYVTMEPRVEMSCSLPFLLLLTTEGVIGFVESLVSLDLAEINCSYGRSLPREHWLSVRNAGLVEATYGLEAARSSGLFSQVRVLAGDPSDMAWLQTTPQPDTYLADHAAAVQAVFQVIDNSERSSSR